MVRDLLQLMYVGMGWLMGLEGAVPRESPSFFNGVGDEGHWVQWTHRLMGRRELVLWIVKLL